MRGSILLIAVASTIAAGCANTSPTAVSVNGRVTNTDQIAITRVVDINRKKAELVERLRVGPDGSFAVSFEVPEPNLYELNFPNGKQIAFVAESGQTIILNGDAETAEFEIKGSAANEILAGYERFRKESLDRLVKSVRAQIKSLPDKSGPEYDRLSRLEVANYNRHKQELLDYVSKEMGTSIAVYATSTRWPADAALIEPIVAAFEKAHPGLEATKRMKEKLDIVRQTSVGGTVPDIRMRDETGNEISLYDSKGKYTLIDFWGSWCGPCRREAATLSGLYEKYKSRGFEIFGVGLESEMRLWKEAKQKDKRVWPNVLSLKEFETEAAYDYAITSLPANFLIDKDGKVLAKDVHEEQLAEKLADLFGQD